MVELLGERATHAIDLALKAGANDAWAEATQVRAVELTYRNGEMEKVSESTSRALRLRLYANGRYSAHVTTDLRPALLERFVKDALALTQALEPDLHRKIPDPALFGDRPGPDLELVDPAVLAISREQRVDWCREMNERVRSHDHVISTSAYTHDNHGFKAVASSNGFEGTWEGASMWMGAEVTLRDHGDVRPEGYMFAGARRLRDLPSPDAISRDALHHALVRLGSKKGPTLSTTMVVDARAAGRLLTALVGPATGQDIQQKRSFWRGRFGEPIASDVLTLVDDPLLPAGIASRTFDDEGISARPLMIIDRGIATNAYVDTYYGNKAGLPPTTGSPSNLLVREGSRSQLELIQEAGQGILVTSWLGGNSDPTTGDFSFGMRGHVIENGTVGAPVGEMNVTGNLMSLFQRLRAVGNDPWRYSTLRVPTLVFDGVDFSGA